MNSRLPASSVFNELNGREVVDILRLRFAQLLDEVPFLQKHITLPRVDMRLTLTLDQWAEQPNPERLEITDSFTMESRVCSAPISGGQPPDKIRDDHQIPVPTPARSGREYGGHLHTSDFLDNRVVEEVPGLQIDRTGTGGVTDAGMAKMQGATVVNMDLGPAGLRQGGERPRLGIFRNER